ncbi:hypothetical protein F8O08_05650 [Pseudoclavibacter sp. CFCC 13611]|nr:hypothetical protein F8O08_05650 [Pseudoclavibacter sp. CFCC 13611]
MPHSSSGSDARCAVSSQQSAVSSQQSAVSSQPTRDNRQQTTDNRQQTGRTRATKSTESTHLHKEVDRVNALAQRSRQVLRTGRSVQHILYTHEPSPASPTAKAQNQRLSATHGRTFYTLAVHSTGTAHSRNEVDRFCTRGRTNAYAQLRKRRTREQSPHPELSSSVGPGSQTLRYTRPRTCTHA